MKLSAEAMQVLEAVGYGAFEVGQDVENLRTGKFTREILLENCLDGAEPEYEHGWRDYVEAVSIEAGLAG